MLKVLELFSGYGSQALALERLGIDHTCDICEIDKYAAKAYNQLHGDTLNYNDVRAIDEKTLPMYDLITYSSPCQSFSRVGREDGGVKGSNTQSSLLWECERIIASNKPKYLLLENVKALTGKKFKPTFLEWLDTLDKLGYNNYWQILNAKDYGIPQNRERVFVVSIRKDLNQRFEFPQPIPLEKTIGDYLDDTVPESTYISDVFLNGLLKHNDHHIEKKTGFLFKPKTLTDVASCLRANGALAPTDNTIALEYDPNTMPQRQLYNGKIIRRLTPRESFRLMGLNDIEIDKVTDISNTQQYKLAGNSIVVDVLYYIFKNLLISTDTVNAGGVLDIIEF